MELELKDFEQKELVLELELKDFEQKELELELELNEKELSILFFCDTNALWSYYGTFLLSNGKDKPVVISVVIYHLLSNNTVKRAVGLLVEYDITNMIHWMCINRLNFLVELERELE